MEDKSKNLKEINKQEPLKTTENPAPQTTPNPANKASIEERVEKAKILIEKKKEEKTLEEMKNEKKAELERRRVGQELLLAKREQQDRELRQLKEEREREKKEEALARQRILDQIAQDRAERAERQNIISKPPQENSNANAAEDKVVEPPTPPAPATSANANIARLQFKLPSGETKSHNFTRDTTLSQVREFIDSNIVRPFGNYQLATTFPRREFTARDNNRNLRELQLIPSAVILIIPTSGSLAARPSFGWTQMIIDMFWDLTQPVISLSRYVCNLIFGRRNTTSTAPVTGQSAANSNPSSLSTRTGGLPTTGAGAAAAAFNTNVAQRLGGTSTIKKRGNIYSLREHRDDDEDNNTWNGNSTQQM
ncbi:hypothetical protein O3M35_010134 [Rhynocoris fuscipes]|uniref:UBX domain-containing protein 4 n=1 Tax=Rhynocoris fuscipes TaxID=488301 RepID=A0AAW1D5I7_9HEMI